MPHGQRTRTCQEVEGCTDPARGTGKGRGRGQREKRSGLCLKCRQGEQGHMEAIKRG